ncbi:MAG: glycosyltransferase family 2 protein [Fibrobacter sp.]|nr:glycosyltransferase family 2 protein [Fibrobacter sp.]
MANTTAIILVTYNGWEMTKACLQDLLPLLDGCAKNCADESTKECARECAENRTENRAASRFVVAIADNGSSDGTVENIRKEFPAEKFPRIHVYPQAGNLGFGAANNGAIRGLIDDGVQFDAVCLLNNDTRFEAKALVELRAELDRVGKNAVLAPTTFNVDGTRQNNFFAGLGPEGIGYMNFLRNAFRNERAAARVLEGTPKATALEDIQETHWSSAVCWMMTAELWNRVGGFDEKIFMYYEDADMALRCRKLGARFFITGRSAITHLGGGSARSTLSRALQHDRSQEYVFKKHFGLRGLWLSKKFRILRSLVRIVATVPHAIVGNNVAEKRAYIKHHLALFKEAVL